MAMVLRLVHPKQAVAAVAAQAATSHRLKSGCPRVMGPWLTMSKQTHLVTQASKQASKQAALADCGTRGCKVFNTYSNSCGAAAFGWANGKGSFNADGDVNPQVAEQKVLAACERKTDNCKIVMSECSLAGDINGR